MEVELRWGTNSHLLKYLGTYRTSVQTVFLIHPNSFTPPPQADSFLFISRELRPVFTSRAEVLWRICFRHRPPSMSCLGYSTPKAPRSIPGFGIFCSSFFFPPFHFFLAIFVLFCGDSTDGLIQHVTLVTFLPVLYYAARL